MARNEEKERKKLQKQKENSQNKINNALKVLMRETGNDTLLIIGSIIAPPQESNMIPLSKISTISVLGDPEVDVEEWSTVPFPAVMSLLEQGKFSWQEEQREIKAAHIQRQQEAEYQSSLVEIEVSEEIYNYLKVTRLPGLEKAEVGGTIRLTEEAAMHVQKAAAEHAASKED